MNHRLRPYQGGANLGIDKEYGGGTTPFQKNSHQAVNSTTANKTPSNTTPTPQSNSAPQNNLIFGLIKVSTVQLMGIALAIIAILIFIIYLLYRRHKTRKDYNQSPQIFSHKPDLGIKQNYYIKNSKIQPIILPEKISITEYTDDKSLNGQYYTVQFKGDELTAVYFHRQQKTICYFQIQVLSLGGEVEIGYLPKDSLDAFKSGAESLGSSGVGVTSSGFIQAEGQNIYNYSWILAYGDVIGMGMSKQNDKFNERRAWISKNGILLNKPPKDEMQKWIATIEISAQQKEEYNLGKQKQGGEEEADEQLTEKQKAQRDKQEAVLKKQRISLKIFTDFLYYPVIICHGNKSKNSTIININVGGQIFRMHDAFFRKGLLNDPNLFGQ